MGLGGGPALQSRLDSINDTYKHHPSLNNQGRYRPQTLTPPRSICKSNLLEPFMAYETNEVSGHGKES